MSLDEVLVRQAYSYIYRSDPDTTQVKVDDLLEGIHYLEAERHRRLGGNIERLISTPLLVRVLMVVHYNNVRMPEQRAELYMKATDAIFLPDYGPDEGIADHIGNLVGGSAETHRDLTQHLGFAMHCRGENQGREISEKELRKILEAIPRFKGLVDDFVALTIQRGSLLEERNRVYRFVHLAFQEYFAGRYLAEEIGDVDGIVSFLQKGPVLESWWRETILLLVGYLCIEAPHKSSTWRQARTLLRRLASLDAPPIQRGEEPSPQTELMSAAIAARAVTEWRGPLGNLSTEIVERLRGLFRDNTPLLRVDHTLLDSVEDALSRLRFRANAWYLPDEPLLGFVEIPASSFVMGDGAESRRLDMPRYYIARYPVTIAQFQAFVKDTARNWRFAENQRASSFRPVQNVTWYDAVDYCYWLTAKLRMWPETPGPLAGLLRIRQKGVWP